ncbi:MAG: hypothetical protein AUJ75_03540 [Candidatus Omnitrophica bacterium CG1_02_49_10]|nr:MAG: hypothetical protein AUJ75_03540 [Candidatus Omnitrophica bacterium CG1_02_49_10]
MKKKARKSSKFNIAQLHWGFPPIIGGVETHLSLMLPVMAKKGHNVSLLTGSVDGSKARYRYKGIDVHRTPLMDLNWLYTRGLKGLEEEVAKFFKNFLDKSKADVIHVHNMHYFSELHAKAIESEAKTRGIPLILTAHNVWDDMLYLDLILKVDWTHIIAVSHFIKKEMIGAGCDDRKITVIHHGVDTKVFKDGIATDSFLKKFPMLKDKRIIFHPARLGLAKGCDVSIKALRLVKRRFPDCMLVLAGTKHIIDWGHTQQKDIAYMVNLVKLFSLEENVLIDVYSLNEIAQIYALAQVCIYPSSAGEPFGLTMLEALSSSRPMIVTNSGGMPEIIRDGINGFVIPVRDFEALASRINQLLADKALRRRLGSTGREIVEDYYTKEKVTDDTLRTYKKFISK